MSRGTKRQNITAILYDRKGNILSLGRNSYTKTHPLQAKLAKQVGKPDNIYLHAEIAALVRCKDWDKIDKLVVMRFNMHGQPMNATPCDICRKAIKLAGIKHVEHT